MTAPLSHECESHFYLGRVLAALLEITWYADCMPFRSTVVAVEPEVFRITLDPYYVVLVDTSRCVLDDPGGLIHEDFPGRLPRTHRYRLTWRDEQGLPISATVTASSRCFARLFASAPANAYVERV